MPTRRRTTKSRTTSTTTPAPRIRDSTEPPLPDEDELVPPTLPAGALPGRGRPPRLERGPLLLVLGLAPLLGRLPLGRHAEDVRRRRPFRRRREGVPPTPSGGMVPPSRRPTALWCNEPVCEREDIDVDLIWACGAVWSVAGGGPPCSSLCSPGWPPAWRWRLSAGPAHGDCLRSLRRLRRRPGAPDQHLSSRPRGAHRGRPLPLPRLRRSSPSASSSPRSPRWTRLAVSSSEPSPWRPPQIRKTRSARSACSPSRRGDR